MTTILACESRWMQQNLASKLDSRQMDLGLWCSFNFDFSAKLWQIFFLEIGRVASYSSYRAEIVISANQKENKQRIAS